MKTIILVDFGHGTRQYTKGKCAPDKSLYEGEWTREVGKRIVNALRELGLDCRPIVTEDEDISLMERCDRVNKIVDDNKDCQCIFLSVHINAAGNEGKWEKASGWTAWVSKTASDKSKTLAQDLYSVATEMGLKGNRSVPAEHYWSANFKVLKSTRCPAVLTENLFMDNKGDLEFLKSEEGKDKLVNLHVMGICKYLDIPYGFCQA